MTMFLKFCMTFSVYWHLLAFAFGGVAIWISLRQLFGGEDYGLLFTVPPERLAAMRKVAARFAVRCIGRVDATESVVLSGGAGAAALPDRGFDHFEKAAG